MALSNDEKEVLKAVDENPNSTNHIKLKTAFGREKVLSALISLNKKRIIKRNDYYNNRILWYR